MPLTTHTHGERGALTHTRTRTRTHNAPHQCGCTLRAHSTQCQLSDHRGCRAALFCVCVLLVRRYTAMVAQRRQLELSKLHEGSRLMREWQEEGYAKHAENIRRRKEDEKSKLRFELSRRSKHAERLAAASSFAAGDLEKGVEEFESTLRRLQVRRVTPHCSKATTPPRSRQAAQPPSAAAQHSQSDDSPSLLPPPSSFLCFFSRMPTAAAMTSLMRRPSGPRRPLPLST